MKAPKEKRSAQIHILISQRPDSHFDFRTGNGKDQGTYGADRYYKYFGLYP